MAISDELKLIYSNYDDNREFYVTVQLYHPYFNLTVENPYPSIEKYPSVNRYPHAINYVSQSYFLIRDNKDHYLEIEDGSTQLFQGYPFNAISPQVGEDQQDLGIILDNVSLEVINGIEQASRNTSVPIIMTYREYIEGSVEPQTTAIILPLTEVVVDMFTVTCKASRVDLFKRSFPYGKNTYYNSDFKGLTV